MPNTGKPSLDCHLCRSRRVKCDLGRPGCQRCVKYGVECPGYRDKHELVFRNANPATVKRRKKRDADKEGTSSNDASSTGASSVNTPRSDGDSAAAFDSAYASDWSLVRPSREHPASPLYIDRAMTEHWTTHSVPILLNIYSTLEFLSNLYSIAPTSGPLIWAAHLFTRTYVSNIRYPTSIYRESERENARELATYLGKTLKAVNVALREPDGALRDDVLATVWILANYELLVGSLNQREPLSPWHLHASGLYSMLKARGSQQLHTLAGRAAFWPCYNMVQIQSMVGNYECPPESAEWLGIIESYLYPSEGFSLHVAVFITKCAHVLATAIGILRRDDYVEAEAQFLNLWQHFTEAQGKVFDYTKTARNSIDIDWYMRNLYLSAILKGYCFLMLLANYLTHYTGSKIPLDDLKVYRAACLSSMRHAAQQIVESVPTGLGHLMSGKDKSPRALFEALKMVWPLTAVYVLPGPTEEQRMEAEVALIFIGNEVGVRQALKLKREPLRLPNEARTPLVGTDSSSTTDIDEGFLGLPAPPGHST